MAANVVTFGFQELIAEDVKAGGSLSVSPRNTAHDLDKLKPRATTERNVGLGTGPGGQLARSFLSEKGGLIIDSLPNGRNNRAGRGPALVMDHGKELPKPELPTGAGNGMPLSLSEGPEPQGMFLALLLNDMEVPADQDLLPIREHRWTFHGASDFAAQGRSFCCFVRCLLDLQRNVQLEEEGDPLDPKLANACKTFVSAQCRLSNMGGMYQLLTHFISNSPVFYEWDQFLRTVFEDERAGKETFLVPHLEQVWGRFCRFAAVLESIFDVLNSRFVWRHRLPKVGDLILDHMKRRCFSSEVVLRNELFSQTACRNDTIKQVKYAFGLN